MLLLTVLGARLYDLQIVQGEKLLERAHRNTIVIEPRPATRGRILDCKGDILVSNAPQFELVVVPGEMRERADTLQELSALLDEKPEKLEQKIRRAAPHAPLVLRRDLSADDLARGTEIAEQRSGVSVRAGAIRRFRYGSMASHLLGYVGEINAEELRTRRGRGYALGDVIGKCGLEKQYDEILRGKKGADQVHIDVLGRTVSQFGLRPSTPGPDLYLHLDADLQREAEKALGETLAQLEQTNGERSGGTVVVMDVSTGAVQLWQACPNTIRARSLAGSKVKSIRHSSTTRAFPWSTV